MAGNDLSINISRDFAYESLYEEATKNTGDDSLSDGDRAIFERFGTTNRSRR